MYKVILKNLQNNKVFEKFFENPYLLNKFKNKCRFSKKVEIIGVVKHDY